MKLSTYLARGRISDEAFASQVDVSRATISRLRRGKMVPSFVLTSRIFAATGGKVTPNDFLDRDPVRPVRPVISATVRAG